jgi:phosphoenolpyruvate phosphomutase
LFRNYILRNLLLDAGDITVVVDAAWQQRSQPRNFQDYIRASRPYSLKYTEEEAQLLEIGAQLKPDQVHGEWIGLVKTSAKGSQILRAALTELAARPDFKKLRFDDLFRHLLAAGHAIRVLYITGHWLDVDDLDDLTAANAFHSP